MVASLAEAQPPLLRQSSCIANTDSLQLMAMDSTISSELKCEKLYAYDKVPNTLNCGHLMPRLNVRTSLLRIFTHLENDCRYRPTPIPDSAGNIRVSCSTILSRVMIGLYRSPLQDVCDVAWFAFCIDQEMERRSVKEASSLSSSALCAVYLFKAMSVGSRGAIGRAISISTSIPTLVDDN